jgi:hypothetical protein
MSAWAHVEVTCANCGAAIALHRDHEAHLRRTHESFYCPAGHSNYFPGKSKAEKEIERLNRQLQTDERMLADWRDRWEKASWDRKSLAVAVQVCPLGCGHTGTRRLPWQPDDEDMHRFLDRVGRDLTEHLTACHNATVRPQRLLTERTGDA